MEPHAATARQRKRVRTRRLLSAVGVAVILSLATSGCALRIFWEPGETHGGHIEAAAARASLVIYLKQTQQLYGVFDDTDSIHVMRDVLWAVGSPPYLEFCMNEAGDVAKPSDPNVQVCFDNRGFRDIMEWALFHGPLVDDLRTATYDARAAGDCLAFTFWSGGAPRQNWTHKSGGCYPGTGAVDPILVTP